MHSLDVRPTPHLRPRAPLPCASLPQALSSKSFLGNASAKFQARRAPVKAAKMVTKSALKAAESLPLEMEKLELPMNTWKNKDPLLVKVKSVERIVGPKATGETCHIIIETNGKAPYWEGQSYGVIPPVRPWG